MSAAMRSIVGGGASATRSVVAKAAQSGEQAFLPAVFGDARWIAVKDGNASARSLFDRHYSRHRYADGRKPKLFAGPGFKLVLLTPCARALFIWRKFISDDGQEGINCAVFRNEGQPALISSNLISAADEIAFARWPGERHYTYVDAKKTASRRSKKSAPGQCFIAAGWRRCGYSKKQRLVILERPP
jgi:hypothetical protein